MPAPKTHARDAGDGEFVTAEYAAEHPDTTVVEADPVPSESGFCHNVECGSFGVEHHLFRPVEQVPVLCRCGQLMSAEKPEQSE